MGTLTKTLLGVFSVAAFNLSSVSPVMSIPPEDAQKKLNVIAAFVLVNEKGDLYEINSDDIVIVPVYLKASIAKNQLGTLKGYVKPYSLNIFYQKAEELRELVESKGKRLETPIVVDESDMVKAKAILKSQGVPEEDIVKGLKVPIFFAAPMLTAQTAAGVRQVFFVTHEQLSEGVSALPEGRRKEVKERVADLSVILDLIKNTKEDKYVFMATKDYLSLRESYLKSQ